MVNESGIPGPDPSTLSTAQLLREISSLEKLLNQRIDHLEEAALRFREDSNTRSVEVLKIIDDKLNERDLRAQQRFDASQQALLAAMAAAEKSNQAAMEASDRAIGAALLAAKEAVLKAEMANEKRFASVNEFRQTLSDQTLSFIPRAEADVKIGALAEKIDIALSRADKNEGRGGGIGATWAILVSVIGIVGTIAAIVVTIGKIS